MYIKGIKIRHDLVENKNKYPFCIPCIKNTDEIKINSPVTFFVGENGAGKSTLLESIAVASGFNAEGGTKFYNFATFDSHSDLSGYITVVKEFAMPKDGFFLRAESFYNMSTELERLSDIEQLPDLRPLYGGSLHEKSHGESFLSVITNRFSGDGLYILDEPESALSPSSQMVLMLAIKELIRENSQFIIATHSPILMAYPDAQIFEFTENGIVPTDYRQTQSYILTKAFLNSPEAVLGKLFDEKGDT